MSEYPPRLARGPKGEAIITVGQEQDGERSLRYVYADGTIDQGSIVDTRNDTLTIGGPEQLPDTAVNFDREAFDKLEPESTEPRRRFGRIVVTRADITIL